MVSSNSPKKRTIEFVVVVKTNSNEFLRSFFGRIWGYQKSFRNYLTFKSHKFWKLGFDTMNKNANSADVRRLTRPTRKAWKSLHFPLSFLQSNCSELGAVCMPLNQDLKLTRCVCSNGVILDHVHPKCSSCKFSEFSLYFPHICDCFLTSQKSCYNVLGFNLSF